mmetsp:Transcript_51356/g.154310  ORF Transcript_51356/g.154310 Transcript_51356/m.154310 type:complete len:98 (+) Transcript_51356:225-518(+)
MPSSAGSNRARFPEGYDAGIPPPTDLTRSTSEWRRVVEGEEEEEEENEECEEARGAAKMEVEGRKAPASLGAPSRRNARAEAVRAGIAVIVALFFFK